MAFFDGVKIVGNPGGGITADGSMFDDFIRGTEFKDTLRGAGGSDQLEGGAGDDILDGGAEKDFIFGGEGNDDIIGGEGDDFLFGNEGNDTINAGFGNDKVEGGAGNDTILALAGVDTIFGDGGNDKITVSGGDSFFYDKIAGASGDDTIIVTGRKVVVDAGSGADIIKTDLARDTLLIGGSGRDRFVLAGVSSVTGSGPIAEIHGGDADYFIAGSPIASIASVTPGADNSIDTLDLSQLTGFNELNVHLGNGTLQDVQGVLYANMTGIENVDGSGIRDLVTGNGGANEVHGGGGNDVLNGEGGEDMLFGDAGSDSLSGGLGNDVLNGGADNDSLLGNSGNDIVMGDAGNDTLNGGAGDDMLVGGTGADTLNGSTGADVLYGDFYGDAVGRDTLTGGAGADRFVFVDLAKETVSSPATIVPSQISISDRITDFDAFGSDHDTIDLSPIVLPNFADSGAQQAINQGFVYFLQHGVQGQLGFGTSVRVDLNGGDHSDSANNFTVVELDGVRAADLNAGLFLV